MFKYVRNLFFAKDGIAIIRPKIIEMNIETKDMYIVVVNPLMRNLRFVNPSTLFGDKTNQSNSCLEQELRNNNINIRKIIFFTHIFIKY